ncbi:MAG: endo-1,4-beta-xylanase [Defluviitaleaceae bacterium]|nr:endo-1,4-beta-xylanase [Defluviitaleaceae bacterium]
MQNAGSRTKKALASLLSLALILSQFSGFNVFAAHDDQEIYSLATDSLIQDLAVGTTGDDVVATPYLNRSGDPTLEIVEHPHGGRSIQISERNQSFYGLDIQRDALGLVEGQRYSIRIAGRVEEEMLEDTQVILGGPDAPWSWLANGAPNANGDFSFTANVVAEQLTDPQFERGFRVQTNNTASFTIDEIVVTWYGVDNTWVPPVVTPPELPPVEPGELFSLASDEGIQGLTIGDSETPEQGNTLLNVTPFLQRAGQPTVTIVGHPVSGNSLQFSNRTATYHTVDLVRSALNPDGLEMEEGHLYTIRFAGRILDFDPADGTQVIIGGAESPWGWLANVAPEEDGSFDLTVALDSEMIAQSQIANRIRLQTNSDSLDFIIDDIVVRLEGRDPAFRPPGYVPQGVHDTPYGYVLRVETTAAQQWDGAQIAAANLGIEAGNLYRISLDLNLLNVPTDGLGLMVQTNGDRWEHLIFGADDVQLKEAGQWQRVHGYLDLTNDTALNFTNIQIVKNGYGPNANANTTFLIDNFHVERINNEVATTVSAFNFENGQVAPFTQSGTALLTIDTAVQRSLIHHVTFGDDWVIYEDYSAAGAQMEGTRVTNFGREDDHAFRLENVTGNYTSGDGNYFRLDLPQPLQMGGTYEISWWVYVPADENPGTRNIVGPGIVFNSTFGSPAHQPTNTQPAPGDVQRSTPMGQWTQTAVVFDLDHTTGDVNHLIFRFRVNNNTQQPSVYLIDDIVINRLGFDDTFAEPEWDLTLPSLAEIWADFFYFGNILEPALIQNNPNGVIDMFLHHYNALTAENAMKPDSISGGSLTEVRPVDGEGNLPSHLLDHARTMVDFAEAHDLYMVGHTLVWHEQSARWLYRDSETGDFLTRAEAMENMRWFIEQYAGYFEGRIHAWDVTNEVFTNAGGANNINAGTAVNPLAPHMLEGHENGRVIYPVGSWQRALRNYASWYQAFAHGADFEAGERGSDYIYYSFVFARRYAPSAVLIYNDFNEEFPAKRDAMANMTEQLNARWAIDGDNNPEAIDVTVEAPSDLNQVQAAAYIANYILAQYEGRLLIEAIGMQAHYNQNTNWNNVHAAIARFAATGARVHVTELDIQFTNAAAPFELSEVQLQLQADWFAQLFRWYAEFADYIDRVSIWGREDGSSWRGQNGATHFDRNFDPKPAFWAIVDPFGHVDEEWPERPERPGQPDPEQPNQALEVALEELATLIDYLATLDEADFTAESWANVLEALAVAEALVDSDDLEAILAAIDALESAIEMLVEVSDEDDSDDEDEDDQDEDEDNGESRRITSLSIDLGDDEEGFTLYLPNGTRQLTATVNPADATESYEWISSDSTVVSVDETGLVTAVSEGIATIYLRVQASLFTRFLQFFNINDVIYDAVVVTVAGEEVSTEPEETTVPTEPEETTASTDPEETTEPTEPEETTVSTEPEETTVSTEPEETTEPTEPEETTAPTEPEETTAPTEPEETTAPTEPEETTAPTEPEETTVSTEPIVVTTPPTVVTTPVTTPTTVTPTRPLPQTGTAIANTALAGIAMAKVGATFAFMKKMKKK